MTVLSQHTVDGCEILHQLIDGNHHKHFTIYRLSTIQNWWFIGFRWPIHSMSSLNITIINHYSPVLTIVTQ